MIKKIFTSVIAFSITYIIGLLLAGFIVAIFSALSPELGASVYGLFSVTSVLAFIYLIGLTVVNIMGWINNKNYSGIIYDDFIKKD